MCCRSRCANSINNGTNICSSPCAASYEDAEVLDSDVVATACRQNVWVIPQLLEDIVLSDLNAWSSVVALVVSLSVARMCTRGPISSK